MFFSKKHVKVEIENVLRLFFVCGLRSLIVHVLLTINLLCIIHKEKMPRIGTRMIQDDFNFGLLIFNTLQNCIAEYDGMSHTHANSRFDS